MTSLSVQLYTLREALAEDQAGTLARLADAGFTQVEPFGIASTSGLGEDLAAAGLTAPTAHQGFIGQGTIGDVADTAAALGIRTVIDPFVAPERWTRAEDIEETARSLNEAVPIAAERGITVGYHNHAHELEHVVGGVSALEYFAGLLDPAVILEIDTYWAAVGGVDPVTLLQRLGDRVAAIHVKDGPVTPETSDQVAVGQGALDIPAILAAAPDALRVIELDDSRGDRFQAVVDSRAYLLGLGEEESA